MNNPLRNHIERLIQITLAKSRPINDTDRLYHDLWISGDDAFEILQAIQKEVRTDFRSFHFTDYFPNETDVLCHLARLLRLPNPKKELTFAHLLAVAEAGTWFDPPQPGNHQAKTPKPPVSTQNLAP